MRSILMLLVASTALAASQPCVILAPAPSPVGIATWSQTGRQERHAMTYLAGDYPDGIPFRSEIKDKEVDKIRAAGGRVLILDTRYTREDLDKAKQECKAPMPSDPQSK